LTDGGSEIKTSSPTRDRRSVKVSPNRSLLSSISFTGERIQRPV